MAATDRSVQSRDTPVVSLCLIIVIKHNDRPKLPFASGKTNTSIAAVKEGRQNTAYGGSTLRGELDAALMSCDSPSLKRRAQPLGCLRQGIQQADPA
jgi:hypothetical protein